MAAYKDKERGGQLMLTAAAFIIIVAGMREAQPLLVPFLLSGFIAIIAAPALFFLKRHRIPTAAALLLVILTIVASGMLLGALVGSSVDDFSAQLPTYQEKLRKLTSTLLGWLGNQGIPVPEQALGKLFDPAK